jgi:hypothetical protein
LLFLVAAITCTVDSNLGIRIKRRTVEFIIERVLAEGCANRKQEHIYDASSKAAHQKLEIK